MYRYQFKPETYKERAEQFLKVGKRQRALETLYDAIKNSRKQKQWSQAFEDTMSLYVRLCVELRDSQMAKDGLHQFRNVSTNTSPQSLEKIVRLYLSLSAKKCEEAKQEADRQAVEDEVEAVDDLETTETPEMLLSQVHHEDRQGRQNRVTLQPWLRFQWEAYRSCIDLLKAHNKYEAMYHDIAAKAFEFVLAYDRRNEFRRLCETLRGHYEQWKMKRETPGTGVDINNQETIELNLRTRLQQLKVAIKMQLWQEAYRAIDDINTFLAELKIRQGATTREFRQKFTHRLSEFYESCAYVFKKAQVHIFHAAALNRRFAMQRTTAQKELADPENNSKVLNEISKLASQLVIASLAVPLQPETEEIDQHLLYDDAKQRKMREMSRLLQLKFLPTRNLLLQELTRNGALEYARPEVQKLYHYMENEFDPQHTCTNIDAVFTSLDAGETRDMFREYLPQLRDVTVSIMLHELSQVYESIKIDSVVALVPWAAREDIERVAVTAAADTELNVHIDHSGSGYFVFGSDITMASTSTSHLSGGSYGHLSAPNASGSGANIGGAGGASYMGKEDRLSNHLVSVYYNLTATVNALDLISQNVLNNALRATGERQLKLFKERESETQKHVLQRKELIKQRYAELEENDKKAQQRKAAEAQETADQRKRRDEAKLLHEKTAVEDLKTLQQRVEADRAKAQVRIDHIKALVKNRPELMERIDEIKTIEDVDKFEQTRKKELELEAQAKDAKILTLEKRNDHLMRALCIEEARLRTEDDVKWQERRAVHWKEQETKRIEQALQHREMAKKRRERLLRMKKFKDEFASEIKQRLQDDYNERLNAWNAEYESELQKRMELRKQERKRLKQEEFERKQQEARDRRNEEIARQREAEEQAEKLAAAARLREQKAAERAVDDEKMKKQKEREAEVMAKLQQKEQGQRPGAYAGRPATGADAGGRPRVALDAPPVGREGFGQNVPVAAAADTRPVEGRRPLNLAPRRDAANAGPTISRDDFGKSQQQAPPPAADRQQQRGGYGDDNRDRREPRYSQPDISADGAPQQRPRLQIDRPRAAPAGGGPEFNRDQMGNAPPPSRDAADPRLPRRDQQQDQGRPYRNDGPRREGESTQFSRTMMGSNLGQDANGQANPVGERPRIQLQRRDQPRDDGSRQPPRGPAGDRDNRPPPQRAGEGAWR